MGADLAQDAAKILQDNCVACHGAASKMSGLDLSSREGMLLGGERGPAVTPHNLRRSRLWTFVTHQAQPAMPPGKKLAEGDLALLKRWIEAGAPVPLADEAEAEAARIAALKKVEDTAVTDEDRAWWAFRQPVKRTPPGTGNAVDAFIAAKWEAEGLTGSPKADPRKLIRRVYMDLAGLPPTPEQVADFVADPSDAAYERVVEELLASPHYGERWARHWMDVVHYADSGGYERDFDWPTMWRYRDWLVGAFNQDIPYDDFIRHQIAGDEIAPEDPKAHVATGYLRMVLDNNIKDERTRMDELDDNVATTSLAFLGMTVGCARCHDHKFDPIRAKDYYQMQAVFFSTVEVDYPLASAAEIDRYDAAVERIEKQQAPLRKRMKEIAQPYRERLFQERLSALPPYYREAWETPTEKRTEGQRLNARQVDSLYKSGIKDNEVQELMRASERQEHQRLEREIARLQASMPEKYATARTIAEKGREALPSYYLHRGDPGSKGSPMDPGVLKVASWEPVKFPAPPADADSSWRRVTFANWIASEENPLTARVMVNRLWQHHFGEGIVQTPSNFGKTGVAPTHPELLDWLAVEFVESGWSVKHMHRLMVLSDAYQMASDDVPGNLPKDGANRFVWRQSRKRHSAETIRDSMLAVAGTLDRSVGGPPVRPHIDPDLFQGSTGRTWPGNAIGDPETWRRSIYVFSKRSIRYPMFEAFDQPDMMQSCERRNESTVAPQALLLMNNAEIMLHARHFAQRVASEAGESNVARVERAYELALAREPSAKELALAKAFLDGNPHGLADFCHTIFNLNEFVYRD